MDAEREEIDAVGVALELLLDMPGPVEPVPEGLELAGVEDVTELNEVCFGVFHDAASSSHTMWWDRPRRSPPYRPEVVYVSAVFGSRAV